MYEIWLLLNIGWELLWMYRVPVLAVLLALAAAWFAARGRAASRGRTAFVLAAVVAFPLALFGLPQLSGSSLGEARYLPDWLAAIGLALGAAVLAGAFAAPIARLLSGPAERG